MKTFSLIIFLLMATAACSQTKGTAKLYGYMQPVSGGAFPSKAIDEGGKEVASETEQRFNYLLYLASSTIVYPSEIWVRGKLYSVTTTSIKTTPVKEPRVSEISSADSARTLVPSTTKKVWQLHLAPAGSSIKQSVKGKSLAKSNELVVVYKMGGKFYYSILPKLDLLEAVAMQ